MPVLTITSRKGGCGKTMVSTALAASLAAKGIDLALLDADPNGSRIAGSPAPRRAHRSSPMLKQTPNGWPICCHISPRVISC